MAVRTGIASWASILVLPVAAASAQLTSDIVKGSLSIGLEPVTDIGDAAIDLTHAGDGSDRLFIAGQTNADVRLYKNNTLVTTPFLDLNGTGGATGAALSMQLGGEMGLLGMAFHPNFSAPGQPGFGKFYTYTSENKGGSIAGVDFIHDEHDEINGGHHDSVIREWTVNPSNPDQILIDTTSTTTRQNSGRVVMRIRQPQSNHNGGAMKFGPDGMLYIALGDGGGGQDQSTEPDGHTDESTSPFRPRGNAQDVTDYALARNENIWGKILRIDPRDPATTPADVGPASLNGRYRLPADNPRLGATDGADEIFAYGLRNPFRMSFDRAGGGDLYVGDVGQQQREEVNIVTSNGNYGWVYWEGSRVNFAEPTGLVDIKPIGEYTHSDGQAVIGGFVYRGHNIPELYGKYVFGELDFNDPATPEVERGRLFYMDGGGGTINEFQYLLNGPSTSLYAFGEDRDGELYALFADGTVRRILGRQWYATGGGSWGTSGNWLGGIPNSNGAAANFLGRLSNPTAAPATITLDGGRTVGSILFNNSTANAADPLALSYRIAPGSSGGGGGALTLNGGASAAGASIRVIKGNHEIAAPVSVATDAEIDVAGSGSLNISGAITLSSTRTLTKTGAGTASLSGVVTMQSTSTLAAADGVLNVRRVINGTLAVDDALLRFLPDGGANNTSRADAVEITSGGQLDLADNKLIVGGGDVGTSDGTTYSGLTGLIQSGRNGGNWDGAGIVTSMPDAQGTLTSLGIRTAQAAGTFGGVSVAAGDALIMYTYGGDANLDGFVSGDDYTAIDFAIAVPGADGWANGDFNYDGFISGDDYTIIDFNIAAQGAPFSTVGAADGAAAIPEPAGALTVLSLMFVRGCLRRRRSSGRD